MEKSIKYEKPAFMCFIDLTKAFDQVRLKDVTDIIIREADIPEEIVRIIETLNKNTITQIFASNTLTEEVSVATGIRQGDSLSSLLFNMIMDKKIIEEVKTADKGYKTDKGEMQILCYADKYSPKDGLQRLLHRFYVTARRYNMEISALKIKSLVAAKEPVRCKLVVNDETIEQVMSFKYLGVEILAY